MVDRWRAGEQGVRAADAEARPALERVCDAIVAELRRRLGGPFTTAELVDLYHQGTDWCLDVAVRVAPGNPAAWDVETVAGAAFARYAREALDFAGGRRSAGG